MRKSFNAKQKIHGLFLGWRTRIVMTLLSKEIQEYVFADNLFERNILKLSFLNFYDQIID